MAGIGFKLQRMLAGDSYLDLIRAYAYSALISSGPMLVVILSLTAVRVLVQSRLGLDEADHFMALIIYCYAFSMIVLGPFVYVITRYLADIYYSKRTNAFTSIYFASLFLIFAIQIIFYFSCFVPFFKYSMEIRWILLSLYLAITGIWVAMLFLSAAKSYQWVVLAFGIGGLVGALASIFLGFQSGLLGFIKGYTFGQIVIFLILSIRIFREFGFSSTHDFGFLYYIKRHPHLVGVGLFYYLAIWVDKMLFWFSPISRSVGSGLRMATDYDTPVFLAYLSIIPSMAFFLIQMETDFARLYDNYFKTIQARSPLGIINQALKRLIDKTNENFVRYALFQGLITGLIIVFIDVIAEAFQMNTLQLGILRISLLGSFIQMGFMMVMNLMFYFDFQKEVFWCCLAYFISNVVFTLITQYIGLPAYGFGYAAANLLALVMAYIIFDRRLSELNYRMFMFQPILTPQSKLEAEQEKVEVKI